MVDEPGALVRQVPLLWVGKTLSQVAWVPATAVRLSTAAPALPSVGMLAGDPLTPLGMPLTFILSTCPGPNLLSVLRPRLQPLAGCLDPRVADPQRRDRMELPRRVARRLGHEIPSTSTTTLTRAQGVVNVDFTLAVGRAALAERDRHQVGDVHVGA